MTKCLVSGHYMKDLTSKPHASNKTTDISSGVTSANTTLPCYFMLTGCPGLIIRWLYPLFVKSSVWIVNCILSITIVTTLQRCIGCKALWETQRCETCYIDNETQETADADNFEQKTKCWRTLGQAEFVEGMFPTPCFQKKFQLYFLNLVSFVLVGSISPFEPGFQPGFMHRI